MEYVVAALVFVGLSVLVSARSLVKALEQGRVEPYEPPSASFSMPEARRRPAFNAPVVR
jgi:hypothetical protein